MSSPIVARRYATALANVIVEREEEQQVLQDLKAWDEMVQANGLVAEAFSNPTVSLDRKRNLLKELIGRMGLRQTTSNFLRVLLRNQRLNQLPAINRTLAEVLDQRSGVLAATITSARPLLNAAKSELETKLAEVSRKKIRLSFTTDESLIGGVITRIGSVIYDGSVRNQLRQLREELAGK